MFLVSTEKFCDAPMPPYVRPSSPRLHILSSPNLPPLRLKFGDKANIRCIQRHERFEVRIRRVDGTTPSLPLRDVSHVRLSEWDLLGREHTRFVSPVVAPRAWTFLTGEKEETRVARHGTALEVGSMLKAVVTHLLAVWQGEKRVV